MGLALCTGSYIKHWEVPAYCFPLGMFGVGETDFLQSSKVNSLLILKFLISRNFWKMSSHYLFFTLYTEFCMVAFWICLVDPKLELVKKIITSK